MQNEYLKIWGEDEQTLSRLSKEEIGDLILKLLNEINTGEEIDQSSLTLPQQFAYDMFQKNDKSAKKAYDAKRQQDYRERKKGIQNIPTTNNNMGAEYKPKLPATIKIH